MNREFCTRHDLAPYGEPVEDRRHQVWSRYRRGPAMPLFSTFFREIRRLRGDLNLPFPF